MKILMLLMLSLLVLSGCASTGDNNQAQIDRITPEELEKLLPPPVATVSLEELVADSKQGKTPEEIIEKIRASDSRYELTPTQNLELSKQGLNAKVLDYIHESNELAKQNAIAEEMNKLEKDKRDAQKQLERERRAIDQYYDPFWGPRYGPYYGYPFGPIGPAAHYWRGSRYGWGMGFGYYGW